MLLFLRPADLSGMGAYSKDNPPFGETGAIKVHGFFGPDGSDILSKNATRHCYSILIDIDTEQLDANIYLDIRPARAAINFAHVLSWFFASAFGVRIDELQATQGSIGPFHAGFASGVTVLSGIGSKMSLGSCIVCSPASIATIAERLLLVDVWKHKATRYLERACMFYCEALKASIQEKNVAYTLLISALECLAASQNYLKSDTMSQEDSELLERVRASPDFGEEAYSRLKSRFYQLKRNCVKVVHAFTQDVVYKKVGTQDSKARRRFVAPSRRDDAISASYDLRSAFIHSGADHSFITSDWWRTDFSNVRSMLSQKLPNTCVKKSLNIYQLDGLVQHCLSSAISSILLEGKFFPATEVLAETAASVL